MFIEEEIKDGFGDVITSNEGERDVKDGFRDIIDGLGSI